MATLGRMLAGVAHEVSTPAASILSNTEVELRTLEALSRARLPEQPARAIETLRSLVGVDRTAAERIGAIVRSVKTLIRSGEEEAPVSVDVNALLRDGLKLVAHEFRRRITVLTEFGELPPVEGYPPRRGQVFLNLLVNAGQAIEGEGKVVVRTVVVDGTIRVSVSDTGRGIDPAHRERIFESGFTTKPAGLGTGLGLSISKDIVERHGGSLDFESAPGEGTTFHVRLPIKREES